MKAFYFTLLFFLPLVVFGQRIQVGPELGMNLIKIETSQIGKNYHPGWHFGGTFNYKFSELFSIRTGVYFTQKRQAYQSFDTTEIALLGLLGLDSMTNGLDLNTYTDIDGRSSQNYIQMPIMADIQVGPLSCYGGVYLGYMIGSKTQEVETKRTPFTSTFNLNDVFGIDDEFDLFSSFLPPPYESNYTESSNNSFLRDFDFGLKAGIGYQLDQVEVNFAYTYGLLDYRINPNAADIQRHQYAQLSINYKFNLGGSTGQGRRFNLK